MNRFKNIDRSSVWLFLVTITACSFTWSERMSSIGIVLLVLHWLLDNQLLQKIKSIQLDAVLISFISFFLIHLVALSWSDYPQEASHTIEVKLSFLILPFLFSTENYLHLKSKKQLFMTFCLSCLVSFLYCLLSSIYHFHSFGIASIFNRMNIADAVMHPGYYSNYFVLGILFCTFEWLKNTNRSFKSIYVLLIILFGLILTLLASKTALIFIFIFAIYIFWRSSNFIKNYLLRISFFVGVCLLFGILFSILPPIKNRIIETYQQSNVEIKQPDFSNSTISRRAAWNLEWQLIKENPMVGYGTGSANSLLLEKFKEKKYASLIKNNMHTHNQFLHTWIDLGLAGIIILIGCLVGCMIQFWKQKEEIGVWFSGLVFINILTDDMLEIQAGIVFFIFFLLILTYQNKKKLSRTYY
jgi:O-antigen ligase